MIVEAIYTRVISTSHLPLLVSPPRAKDKGK